MSHHSYDPDDSPIHEALRQELGATKQHPEGKLTPKDEGGIQFAIGIKDGSVVLDFGDKPISWVGMNPEDALKLAESLIEKARLAAKGQSSILTLNL